MANEKTPDEVLEEQRAEATRIYALNVSDLQKKANELKEKCDDMESTIRASVAKRMSDLEVLGNHLTERTKEAEDKYFEAQDMLRDLNFKKEIIEKELEELNANKIEHENNVVSQLNALSAEKDSILLRHDTCGNREEESLAKQKCADEKYDTAINKEQSLNLLIQELDNKRLDIDTRIIQQNELAGNNKSCLDKISSTKEELIAKEKDLIDRESTVDSLRLQVDAERKALANRKVELDKKENDLKQISVKNALDLQRLQDTQRDVDSQLSKLNDLKNNVESLMKTQQI